jgi:hypothetical protein
MDLALKVSDSRGSFLSLLEKKFNLWTWAVIITWPKVRGPNDGRITKESVLKRGVFQKKFQVCCNPLWLNKFHPLSSLRSRLQILVFYQELIFSPAAFPIIKKLCKLLIHKAS